MFRTQEPGDSISVALRKLLQGGREEIWMYTSFQQREQAVWTSKIRYQAMEFSILFMGGCNHLCPLKSFLSCTLAIWGQSCFLIHLASCILPIPQQSQCRGGGGGWQHLLDLSFGSLIHIWRPEIADGCDISCWLIWKEIFSFHTSF